MFKRMFTMIMVMAMIIGTFAVSAGAVCLSNDGRPDIIGLEHLDIVMEIDERLNNDEIELDYMIEMCQVEGYWCVYLTGEADAYYDYEAFGMYNHMPTEEEIDILWANRMLSDELYDLMDKYGI